MKRAHVFKNAVVFEVKHDGVLKKREHVFYFYEIEFFFLLSSLNLVGVIPFICLNEVLK